MSEQEYGSDSIKVLKGWKRFKNVQGCTSVIPMTEPAFTIWFLRWSTILLMKLWRVIAQALM